MTDIVAEIAAASKEQLTGIEQVNKAVAQMDRVTQGNASQTEEMSGTADMLLGHSQQLAELVGRFQLDAARADASAAKRSHKAPADHSRDSAKAVHTPAPIVTSNDYLPTSSVLEF